MKNLFTLCFCLLSLTVLSQQIPFQGRLLDNGKPFNGVATLDFSIDDPSWSESKVDVAVEDGYYAVVLGDTSPLPDTLFSLNPEVILNISVNGQMLSPVTLYSPLLPYTGPEGIEVDTLRTFMAEAIGADDEGRARIATTNNGYDGVVSLTDSLGRTGNFMQTRKTGGYLQLAQQDFTDNSFKSATIMGTLSDQNSFMELYGGNSSNDGISSLVLAYASNIDLNGPIPDGYRRGGIDIRNYYGNFTHNIFSEQIGTSTISHININASTDVGGEVFTANINSGDATTSGASLNLSNFDGAAGFFADGTDGGSLSLGENKVSASGNFNSTGAGGFQLFDATSTERVALIGSNGQISSFGPSGSSNVTLRGRGDGDFGYVEMFNNNNETRAEIGSFGDNSGFMILYGNNGAKNIQIDRNPSNTDLGQINVFGTDGITARVFASADTDGNNEWGFLSLDGPSGGIQLDGNSGVITAVSLTQTSDKRMKDNIIPLQNALINTLKLNGVSYNWKDKNASQKPQIGLIAQEVEEVYPEFVQTDTNGMKSVNYAQITAVLIESIKELNLKIESLEAENAVLEASLNEIKTLRNQINQLMQELGSSKAASK